MEAKFILEITKENLKVDIQGNMVSLVSLFTLACEENKEIEKIMKIAIETMDLYNKYKDEGEVPKV